MGERFQIEGKGSIEPISWAILCSDLQSAIAVMQIVREKVAKLVKSWVVSSDIKIAFKLFYKGDLTDLSESISHFRMQMLDLISEEQLANMEFKSSSELRVTSWVDSWAWSVLHALRLHSVWYDVPSGSFLLARDHDSRPKRSTIKDTNRKLWKPHKKRI